MSEERAGLDARGDGWTEPNGTPVEVGEHPHYAIWNHADGVWEPVELSRLVHFERVRLAEAFREWVAIVNYDRPRFTQDVADKFLALLEDKAEPSGGME